MILTTRLTALFLCLFSTNAISGGVYQEPDEFIKASFPDGIYKKDIIWPDKPTQEQMTEILGHKYKGLRVRYWINDTKTAWILDEIGKDKPITAGFLVKDNQIEKVRVLIFRESRGWEVRHAFFTDQFNKARLTDDDATAKNQLDRNIDNISGATLSVRAISKLSRIALLLHKKIIDKE